MLELTGKCCSAEQAIDFFESLANIVPEDDRTDEFCDEFEQALNRFRYEAAQSALNRMTGKYINLVNCEVIELEF